MKITFKADGKNFVAEQTGSSWNIIGEAVSGPLVGRKLKAVVHGNHLWVSWAVFRPDRVIYHGGRKGP